MYLYCNSGNEKLQTNNTLNSLLNISFLISLYYIIRFKQTNKQTNAPVLPFTAIQFWFILSVYMWKKEKQTFSFVAGVFVFPFLLYILSFKITPFTPVLLHRLPFLFFVLVFTFRSVLLPVASHVLSPTLHNFHISLFKQSLNSMDEQRFVSSSNDNDATTDSLTAQLAITQLLLMIMWQRSDCVTVKD